MSRRSVRVLTPRGGMPCRIRRVMPNSAILMATRSASLRPAELNPTTSEYSMAQFSPFSGGSDGIAPPATGR